jgi:hypothetical protein
MNKFSNVDLVLRAEPSRQSRLKVRQPSNDAELVQLGFLREAGVRPDGSTATHVVRINPRIVGYDSSVIILICANDFELARIEEDSFSF